MSRTPRKGLMDSAFRPIPEEIKRVNNKSCCRSHSSGTKKLLPCCTATCGFQKWCICRLNVDRTETGLKNRIIRFILNRSVAKTFFGVLIWFTSSAAALYRHTHAFGCASAPKVSSVQTPSGLTKWELCGEPPSTNQSSTKIDIALESCRHSHDWHTTATVPNADHSHLLNKNDDIV